MVLKELINSKGYPKILFDSYKEKSFCIYDLEEEIILNSDGCFLNGNKIHGDPLKLLQTNITKWKKSKHEIACIGFCSYNLKDYIYPHIQFRKKNNDVPLFWFAKPKKVYFLNNTDLESNNVIINKLKQLENFNSYNNIIPIKKNFQLMIQFIMYFFL